MNKFSHIQSGVLEIRSLVYACIIECFYPTRCDPGVWRCLLKAYCLCKWWGSCWQQCCRFWNWGVVMKLNFCSDIERKVSSRFWSSSEILKLKFAQYFAADVWLRLQSWILVKILVEMLMYGWDFEVNAYLIFWILNLIQDLRTVIIWCELRKSL